VHHDVLVRSPDDITDSLRGGDLSAVDDAVTYLEQDPWEFRSGYAKATLLRRLKHVELSSAQRARLEHVLLRYVDVGWRWDFREASRLARHLDSDSFRTGLRTRLSGRDVDVALRAISMLLRLRHPKLTTAEQIRGQDVLLRWAAAYERSHDESALRFYASIRTEPPGFVPLPSLERFVRRLWTNEWHGQLRALASGPQPDARGARRLLAAAPRSARTTG
jgi:hypothetical protein